VGKKMPPSTICVRNFIAVGLVVTYTNASRFNNIKIADMAYNLPIRNSRNYTINISL
jgi:hypothetical protein